MTLAEVPFRDFDLRTLAANANKELGERQVGCPNVKLKVLAFQPEAPIIWVRFQLFDPKEHVLSVELVNARGLNVNRGMSGPAKDGTISLYDHFRELPEDTRLRIWCMDGRKKYVFPFLFNDIPLP